MFRKALFAIATVGFVAPAYAGPGADAWAVQLGLTPGHYTLNELSQIAQVTGRDRVLRIKLIEKNRAAFEQKVAAAMAGSGTMVSTSGE
ncbi:hypothetical protein [Primorskyibacter sp. 2E233]|uniref:hypothetical protein n=1 Tax=Primorskyibacter sp. 2E233 TaxID=3413431 RepID=UPI003BEF8560